MQIGEFVSENWGIKSSFKLLYGERDLNYLIESDDEKYILKLHHSDTGLEELEAQNRILQFLKGRMDEFKFPEVIPGIDGKFVYLHDKEEGQYHARLLSWIEGELWSSASHHTEEMYRQLGIKDGKLTQILSRYSDPTLDREFMWVPSEVLWIEKHLNLFNETQKEVANHFLNEFRKMESIIRQLPRSVVYHDANDNNIIVDNSNQEIKGFIDFGDCVLTHTINELAVTLAYAMMNSSDPLELGRIVVNGFAKFYKPSSEEIAALYSLVAGRLLISVTLSAIRRQKDPENTYNQVSEQPAWTLLSQWKSQDPKWIEAVFRHACGYESVKDSKERLASIQKMESAFLLGDAYNYKDYGLLDLSVGSSHLGNNSEFEDPVKFEKRFQYISEDYSYMVGGYLETRPVYSTDQFVEEGNFGKKWRTVHLGDDFWCPAGTEIFTPYDGKIVSAYNNQGASNYGPTLIIEHQSESGHFYTLYGHLSKESIDWEIGTFVKMGDKIATLGDYEVNGNWIPHLHFQVILELWGNTHDFPGVSFFEDKEIFAANCPDPGVITGISKGIAESGSQDIIDKRSSSLPSNLSMSYHEPLYILRGYKQFLYDSTGRRYLDTVNNVAHVGHEHPQVVEAIKRQSALLNTNTRYLHHEVTSFAEELLETFPSEFEVCYFTNSGSEANELALRIARTVTAREDMIALEMGYHGNTSACIEVSSYKFNRRGGKGKPGSTHILSSPDTFRYPEREQTYAIEIDSLLQGLEEDGRLPAGVIAESILSCAGQVVPPARYFKKLYDSVREKGGLCIADEVQVGFGRVGKKMWGFELFDVVPDIVTLGKPIGNGHPLGAVVTTRAIAESFSNGMEYFNTFGGNPVSSAVGRSVLEIIKKEGLQSHALEMGDTFKSGLRELQSKYPIIADVRGEGLFLGFELIDSNGFATKTASLLSNEMRRRAILTSTDGPDENVIKIKPPMCIQEADIGYFLDQLDKSLNSIS